MVRDDTNLGNPHIKVIDLLDWAVVAVAVVMVEVPLSMPETASVLSAVEAVVRPATTTSVMVIDYRPPHPTTTPHRPPPSTSLSSSSLAFA